MWEIALPNPTRIDAPASHGMHGKHVHNFFIKFGRSVSEIYQRTDRPTDEQINRLTNNHNGHNTGKKKC